MTFQSQHTLLLLQIGDIVITRYFIIGTATRYSLLSGAKITSDIERPLPEKHAQNVLIDEIIKFERPLAKEKYPKRLRRIVVWNDEYGYTVELLTNNLKLAESTIAEIYANRDILSQSQTVIAN